MPKIIDEKAIYKAVIPFFSLKGYQGSTTRELAAVAGISEITLFRKFGTKATLLIEAIGSIFEELDIENSISFTGDLEGDLQRIVDAYLSLLDQYGDLLLLILWETRRNEELSELMQYPLHMLERFGVLIEEYQRQGMFPGQEPKNLASALLGPLMYHRMLDTATLKAHSVPFDSARYVREFLHGRS